MAWKKYIKNITVLSGQTESDVIDLSQATLVGIFMPAAYTAGDITFKSIYDQQETFAIVTDSAGNALTIASPAAGKEILLGDINTKGLWYTKLVCANAQAATRTFKAVYVEEIMD